MEPFIKINGLSFPFPKRGLELVTATFVDSARNTAGQVVGQKVGRDQYKINRCEWPVLTADQWGRMLSVLDNFFVDVTFPDPVRQKWLTVTMYPGDRSGEPYFLDEITGLPTLYRNCRVNLIDAGYGELSPVPPSGILLQEKNLPFALSAQRITPDGGYNGLSVVTINAAPKEVVNTTSSYGATPDDVTIGRECYVNGTKIVGTRENTFMGNLQKKRVTPGYSQIRVTYDQYTYDGLEEVIVDPIPHYLVDTRDATAVAGDIANGKTAYVNGQKITGTSTGSSCKLKLLQTRATKQTQTILPPEGYDGFNKVIIYPMELREVTVKSTSEVQTIRPPQLVDGFSTVKVDPVHVKHLELKYNIMSTAWVKYPNQQYYQYRISLADKNLPPVRVANARPYLSSQIATSNFFEMRVVAKMDPEDNDTVVLTALNYSELSMSLIVDIVASDYMTESV